MKRIIAASLILAYMSGLLFAQTLSDLSFEQATEYAERILTIDSAYKNMDQARYAADTNWIPNLGGQPVSRPMFFEIAGATDAMQKYEAVQKRNKTLRVTSWTMLGISLVSGVTGTVFLSHDFIGESSTLVGSILTGVGIAGLLGFTIPIFLIEDEDRLFTASFAIKLANTYNEQLLQAIVSQ